MRHPGVHLVHAGPDEVVALKPAGLASEMPRDPDADSLVLRLRRQGVVEPRLVHRLDAPACGLVLVAGSRAAAAYYAAEIAARRLGQVVRRPSVGGDPRSRGTDREPQGLSQD